MIKYSRIVICLALFAFFGGGIAFSATHNVDLVGLSFVSDEITIVINDTVKWEHISGPPHTVTSGFGPADPDVGLLFDTSLPVVGSTFSYTFTVPGDYPYFCRPHFGAGMTGIVHVVGTVRCDYNVLPASGTLPFVTHHTLSLTNNYGGQTRRVAARIGVITGNGSNFPNWKGGFTDIAAGSSFNTSFNTSLPSIGLVVGNNSFTLSAFDVTPAPFNQPPYPPAGDSCTASNIVLASP